MAQKHRRLKPAAYAVINAAVFAVCAFTFYQIGLHRNQKSDTTNHSLESVTKITTSTQQSSPETSTITTTSTYKIPTENSWRYWEVPWANAYQKLLWSGEYLDTFLKNAVFLNTNGYSLDAEDGYRDLMKSIEIYAALIYLDEDDIPELALTSAYHTEIYTFANDTLELVASIDTLNDMCYYPKKMWLADHFYRTMGGISYVNVYDFSEQGLKSGTEQLVHFDYRASEAEEYALYPDENGYEFAFGGEWTEIKRQGILVSSFSPNDVITHLHDQLSD